MAAKPSGSSAPEATALGRYSAATPSGERTRRRWRSTTGAHQRTCPRSPGPSATARLLDSNRRAAQRALKRGSLDLPAIRAGGNGQRLLIASLTTRLPALPGSGCFGVRRSGFFRQGRLAGRPQQNTAGTRRKYGKAAARHRPYASTPVVFFHDHHTSTHGIRIWKTYP